MSWRGRGISCPVCRTYYAPNQIVQISTRENGDIYPVGTSARFRFPCPNGCDAMLERILSSEPEGEKGRGGR